MPGKRVASHQIRYSAKSSMKGPKTARAKGYEKTAVKIKGLKNDKRYYFQVRTYV